MSEDMLKGLIIELAKLVAYGLIVLIVVAAIVTFITFIATL